MTRRLPSVLVTLALVTVIVVGVWPVGDRVGEQDRVRAVASRLRCPVCSSESVADSPSGTAREMTEVIEEQVAAGRSDGEVLAFFRERYGDWILLDPPTSGRTLLVWVLPVLALTIGVLLLFRQVRRSRPLDDAARHLVDEALAGGGP